MLYKKIESYNTAYVNIVDDKDLVKQAAATKNIPDEILKIADEAYKSREFKRNVVSIILILTSWETYGPNDNDDAFMEDTHDSVIRLQDIIPNRYKTFEEGHLFKYHQSDNPSKAIGKIHHSHYNEEQHRVELVVEVSWDKAPTECKKLLRNESLNVSMGCAVEYDICSVCGNKAKTASQHCTHITQNLHGVVDNIPVYMINAKPKWYDASIVIIPGDMNAVFMYTANIGKDE